MRRNPLPEKRKSGANTMANGSVKKVISDRGFGFITADDGKDYFFHRDGLDRSIDFDKLVGGEHVTFEVESGPKGPRAIKVQAA
jgi:CspA family cold shock protein